MLQIYRSKIFVLKKWFFRSFEVYQPLQDININLLDTNNIAVQTIKTDEKGLYVFDNLSNGIYRQVIKDFDTSSYVKSGSDFFQKTTIENKNPYVPSNIVIKERILPQFANTYAFESNQTTYSEITGTVIGQGNYIPFDYDLSIPFDLHFGNKTYNELTVWSYGFVTFGYTETVMSNPLASLVWSDGIIAPFATTLQSTDSTEEFKTSLSYAFEGDENDRVLTIQWKNFYDYDYSPLIFHGKFNFQLKIHEDGNLIEFIYGDCIYYKQGEDKSMQIGIRGSDILDFNTRKIDYNNPWANSRKGEYASDTALLSSTLNPSKGLVYKWSRLSGVNEAQPDKNELSMNLNPTVANENVAIEYKITSPVSPLIEILNEFGERVISNAEEIKFPGQYINNVNIKNLPTGVYFCKLSAGNRFIVKKFIVLK